MADVTMTLGSFTDTDATVHAVSDSARALFAQMFGTGAVEATMPKSRGFDFVTFCERNGLTIG